MGLGLEEGSFGASIIERGSFFAGAKKNKKIYINLQPLLIFFFIFIIILLLKLVVYYIFLVIFFSNFGKRKRKVGLGEGDRAHN